MVIKKSSATWNLREKVDNPSLFKLFNLELQTSQFFKYWEHCYNLAAKVVFLRCQESSGSHQIVAVLSILENWLVQGSRLKAWKEMGCILFPSNSSSWRVFNHHTSPSVFCILCKSLFGEMVPSSCLMGHQQCSLNNVNGFVEVHHVIFSYWILLTY